MLHQLGFEPKAEAVDDLLLRVVGSGVVLLILNGLNWLVGLTERELNRPEQVETQSATCSLSDPAEREN